MNIFKKKPARLTAFLLSIAVISSCVGISAYAAGANADRADDPVPDSGNSPKSSVGTSNLTASRDETVYVIAGADGSPQKIIVSDWIKNPAGNATLEDGADLNSVVNVKGDESYTINSDNMRVWNTEGNDLYTRGESGKELPVSLSIRYTLDGKAISPDELAGKSGKVAIRFDYTNNQYEWVEIDGKKEKISVPFVILTGMVLDNEHFKNIEVSNGRLLNDGDRTVVAGLALPGLSENLRLDDSEYSLPDFVEITADVTDFELTTTLTLATNEVFNEIDLGDADSLEELKDSMDQLTEAMEQLTNGSSALYDGLSTLLDRSGTLIAGIDQLTAGAGELADGTKALESGSAALQAGIAQLSDGLKELGSNSAALNAGAKQVFDSLLSQANSQLSEAGISIPALTPDNYASVLQNLLDSIKAPAGQNPVYQKINAAVRSNEAAIRTQVTAAVRKNVLNKVLAAAGNPMTAEDYEAAAAAGNPSAAPITAALEAQMNSAGVQAMIQAETEKQIEALTQENLKTVSAQLTGLKTQLDSYNEFYKGLLAYTAGVDAANSGAGKLNEGASALVGGISDAADGAQRLSDGANELKNGSGALTDGISQLKEGAMQLSGGLKQFDEEGIQKLSNVLGDEIDGFFARLRATLDVSKDYASFADSTQTMGGAVRFIYRTDSIRTAE